MDRPRIGHTRELPEAERLQLVEQSARTIGRAVVSSILITLVSFAPILLLTGQEKKLFTPLVLTKTFCMMGSAFVAVFILPMTMGVLLKGKLIPNSRNPVSRFFIGVFAPVVRLCLRWKKTVLLLVLALVLVSIPVVLRTGTEFMPPLDEGSLLMMPTTLPDVSYTEAKRILQVQDKLLKSFPEVANVLGKAGRAGTATDNAPLSMIETVILLKPRAQWREGMTKERLIAEMNERVRIPGVSVAWTQPIINRINMLSTGIRTDVGVKIYGRDLDSIYVLAQQVRQVITGIPGLVDLYVEPLTGGKYLEIDVRRGELARYGLDVDDVGTIIETALGGARIGTTVEKRERFTISVRLAQDFRNNLTALARVPVQTAQYGPVPLSAVATLRLTEGPAMINSENALLRGTVLFNVRGRDMGGVVGEAKERVAKHFPRLPQGYYIEWSGQYENQVSAQKRLQLIIPGVLLVICFILYFTFKSLREVLIVLSGMPLALLGGIYSLHLYGVNFSVSVAVGFIALFGVAMETGVLLLVYLNQALENLVRSRQPQLPPAGTTADEVGVAAPAPAPITQQDIENAVFAGAVLRIRPVLMTVVVDMLGLFPVLAATGVGSDLMRPLALPYVFGLVTSTLYALIVVPTLFALVKEWEWRRTGQLTYLSLQD
ncbi:efflux RND transporter permease subunit [Hymenobacter lutimineralis]|uniref:Efflux RND transporter permease subunit n=1 Tax=Hymenobacter lutimineralis TaxID=2606448 RepID=A0A5D6UUQ3_9BACT|nr:efflux RND transporter permease subunit [Hymenobacter lutimineralis]TYZ07243.1 efflux RND transporter permease subunit [Hymenobacter lutimineralis]